MIEIVLNKISKKYNPGLFKKKVSAVSDLSIDVYSGEVFGLIGPNGAGKSTTIRLLLGLISPDEGTIRLKGKVPGQTRELMSEVGYLPENPYLYEHLTLNELLAFSGRVSGMNARMIAARSSELRERLGLGDAGHRPVRTFSKGMLQRAGVCFALIHDPTVVILDEPMSGLDPIGRKMVFDLVMELKSKGKTVFFCSHILSDVERLSDRIGMLVKGRLVATYEKKDFCQGNEPRVYLVVPPLSAQQRQALLEEVEKITDERSGHILSVVPSRLGSATALLSSLGIEICASRSEPFSLEELFMQVVEEQKI